MCVGFGWMPSTRAENPACSRVGLAVVVPLPKTRVDAEWVSGMTSAGASMAFSFWFTARAMSGRSAYTETHFCSIWMLHCCREQVHHNVVRVWQEESIGSTPYLTTAREVSVEEPQPRWSTIRSASAVLFPGSP